MSVLLGHATYVSISEVFPYSFASIGKLWFSDLMAERAAQLLEILRSWCREKRGRQTQVARIVGVKPASVSDWLSGRRQFTGEQSLAVREFLHTVYAYQDLELLSDDPLQKLHRSLEHPEAKNAWVRTIGAYHHVILGGPNRNAALGRLLELLKMDRK